MYEQLGRAVVEERPPEEIEKMKEQIRRAEIQLDLQSSALLGTGSLPCQFPDRDGAQL